MSTKFQLGDRVSFAGEVYKVVGTDSLLHSIIVTDGSDWRSDWLHENNFELVAMGGPGPNPNVKCDGQPLAFVPTEAVCSTKVLPDGRIEVTRTEPVDPIAVRANLVKAAAEVHKDCTCETLLSGHHPGCPFVAGKE